MQCHLPIYYTKQARWPDCLTAMEVSHSLESVSDICMHGSVS